MISQLCQFGDWGWFGNISSWGWIAMILVLVFWVASIIAALFLIIWAIRRVQASRTTYQDSSQPPSAMEILQARFARGEITRQQFEQMQQDIA